jgi:hypothetical protein
VDTRALSLLSRVPRLQGKEHYQDEDDCKHGENGHRCPPVVFALFGSPPRATSSGLNTLPQRPSERLASLAA